MKILVPRRKRIGETKKKEKKKKYRRVRWSRTLPLLHCVLLFALVCQALKLTGYETLFSSFPENGSLGVINFYELPHAVAASAVLLTDFSILSSNITLTAVRSKHLYLLLWCSLLVLFTPSLRHTNKSITRVKWPRSSGKILIAHKVNKLSILNRPIVYLNFWKNTAYIDFIPSMSWFYEKNTTKGSKKK